MSKGEYREGIRLYAWLILGITLMLAAFLFSSCRTRYIPMESETRIVEKATLVPVVNPADSAAIRAFLECDEYGKVVLRWFDIEKSKNMQLRFSLDSLGNLLAAAKTAPDTVYLPSKETIIEKKVPAPYPIEKELSRWEKAKVELGGWAFGILIAYVSFIVIWITYKRKHK